MFAKYIAFDEYQDEANEYGQGDTPSEAYRDFLQEHGKTRINGIGLAAGDKLWVNIVTWIPATDEETEMYGWWWKTDKVVKAIAHTVKHEEIN